MDILKQYVLMNDAILEEREYVKNNTEPSMLKTATLGEIDRQIKERRG